jgi:hypothetical protein
MAKLKRYRNFKALKSDAESNKAASVKDKKLLIEFEAFLNLLQTKFSPKKKIKTAHGEQFSREHS